MHILKRYAALALFLLMTVAAAATAAEAPRTASPGDPSRTVEIGRACPTFSWEQVEAAEAYEVAVFRLSDAAGEELVARRVFAGSVDSWTPSLGECLTPGGRYAWSVRATKDGAWSAWSTPSLFRVTAGPSRAAVEEVLELAELVLRAQTDSDRSDRSPAESAGAAKGDALVATPGSRFEERTVAETLLSVDGGIEAAFFSGDGSTLTSLDPAHLSPGTAVIGVTGSSGSLSCSGCVDTANIGDGQVTSAAIGDGQVGREQIDPSSVQKRVGTICNTYRAINSVNEDGSAVCEEMTRIRSAQSVYVYADSNIPPFTLDREDLYLCFLVRVAFWDVDGTEEDAWCNMTLSADGALWSLDALGEDDSTAKCTMECMEVYPAGRSF